MMFGLDSSDTLVIGFGNECRGDDGVGPNVARQIAAFELPKVHVLAVHQLTPELAEVISRAERVFFVDSSIALQPAPVHVAAITDEGGASFASHRVDPGALLALSRLLYGRAPRAWLVTVEGKEFEPSEMLSDSADRHAEEAVRKIVAMLT
jgi:hydrogenase maturation protease